MIKNLPPSKDKDVWTPAINAVTAEHTAPTEDVALYCCRQIVIPPHSQVSFKGRIGAKTRIQTGVLEPASTLSRGVMMYQAAVKPDDGNKV